MQGTNWGNNKQRALYLETCGNNKFASEETVELTFSLSKAKQMILPRHGLCRFLVAQVTVHL